MISAIISLALALALAGSSVSPAPRDVNGNPAVSAEEMRNDFHQAFVRLVQFDNGDHYEARKVVFALSTNNDYVWDITLPGTTGTVKYFDTAVGWTTVPLSGSLPYALLHIDTESAHMILNPAHVYKRFGTSLEEQSGLIKPVTVKQESDSFTLSLRFPHTAGLEGHSWYLKSDQPLIGWNAEHETMWKTYGRLADQRWSYDGYYYKTPESYVPYSNKMYWRNPGAYLPRAVTITGQSAAADRLSFIMLDTMLTYQNTEGYWLSDPESGWLKSDYGIGAGFYDTRFNADTTETYITGFKKSNDARFLAAAIKQLEYYQGYAEKNHYEIKSGERTGWLVYDYTWPGQASKPALCALNHQLQEIYALLYAYEVVGYGGYYDLSEKLMEGIRLTKDKWIKPDGSLQYAYLPDGTMGKDDYASLTYNNLYDLQNLRTRMGLGIDPDLQALMDSKKAQMDRDGITDYRK